MDSNWTLIATPIIVCEVKESIILECVFEFLLMLSKMIVPLFQHDCFMLAISADVGNCFQKQPIITLRLYPNQFYMIWWYLPYILG